MKHEECITANISAPLSYTTLKKKNQIDTQGEKSFVR